MQRHPLQLVLTFLSISVVAQATYADTYRVTISNLTKAQHFSPPVCAVHAPSFRIFTLGVPSSAGLALVAEDGISSTLRGELLATQAVTSVQVGSLIVEGTRGQLSVSGNGGTQLSCVGMLGTTNDGFFGIRNVPLPRKRRESVTVLARAYDAGSESNSESCAKIPGSPCGSFRVRDTTGAEGVVTVHPGIKGIGDLDPKIYGWNRSVARVVITSTK